MMSSPSKLSDSRSAVKVAARVNASISPISQRRAAPKCGGEVLPLAVQETFGASFNLTGQRMPPRAGRRQVAADDEDAPTPTQTQRNRRRDDTPEEDEDVDMEDNQDDNGSGSLEQLSKGLVRYALSCEYARKPIKRQDVNEKGENSLSLSRAATDRNSAWITCPSLQRSFLPRQ